MTSIASPSLKELLAELRAQTTCPCGKWVSGSDKNAYHISWRLRPGPDGGHDLEFEEDLKCGDGSLGSHPGFAEWPFGKIVAPVVPTDDAWRWNVKFADTKHGTVNLNLHFREDGMLQCSVGQDRDGVDLRYATMSVHAALCSRFPEVWKTIASCAHQIEFVYGVCELGQSAEALHEVVELWDGYSKRYKAVTGRVNPSFIMVMECIARSAASIIQSSTRPNISVTVRAAQMVGRLCQWQWRPWVAEEYLHSCLELFSNMLLDWEAASLRTSLNSLAWTHLQALQDQLEVIAGHEAATRVDHAGFLMLAGATAACLQQTIPLQGQGMKELNLERLISRCHSQYPPETRFLQQVGPRLAEAVPAGTATEDEAAQRLAHCVKHAVELRGQLHDSAAVWRMVTACSPSTSLVGKVVLKLCRAQPRSAQPPTLDPAPDFVYEVLWPLLDLDLPTDTVQELLESTVQQRITRGWEASAILSALWALVEARGKRSRRVVWHRMAQEALVAGVQSCSSKNLARQMFYALHDNPWLDPEDLCTLCVALTTAMGAQNTSRLRAAAWVPLITKCLGQPGLETLLRKALLEKPKTAAELVAFLRELRVGEVFQGELPDSVHSAVAQTKPFSLPLDILLGSGQRDVVANLFLKHWVPGVDAAPPGSPAESEFLAWVKDSSKDVSCCVADLRPAQSTSTELEPMLLRAHAARRIQHAWRSYVAVRVEEQGKEPNDATVAKAIPDPEKSTLESSMNKFDVGVQWSEPEGMQEITGSIGRLSVDGEVASGQAWEVVSHCTSASLRYPPSVSRRGRKNEVDRFALEVVDVQNLDVEGTRLPLPDFEPSPEKKCSESFLEGAKLLVPEQLEHLMDSACKSCKRTLKIMVKQAGSLKLQELFAVLLFLFDVRLVNPAAPVSASFYSLLRRAVREREQAVLVPLNDYLCHLQSGLKKLPVVEGPIYCGAPAEASTALSEFQEGEKVGWSTFVSFTPVLRVAKDAAGPEGTVLGVMSKTARNLSSINHKADPSQRLEVVLLPGTRLTVGSKERNGEVWLFWLEECNFDEAEDSDDIDV